jgi:hypothetical protein
VLLCRSSAPLPFESELYEDEGKRRAEVGADAAEGDESGGLGNSSTRLGREKAEGDPAEGKPPIFYEMFVLPSFRMSVVFRGALFWLSIPTSGLGLVRLLIWALITRLVGG